MVASSFGHSPAQVNSNVANLKATCDAMLGSPSLANCVAAAGEFERTSPVVFNPDDGPLIRITGDCAIAVGFQGKTTVSWNIIKTVVDSLLEQCLGSPVTPRIGGIAIPQSPQSSKKGKRGTLIRGHVSIFVTEYIYADGTKSPKSPGWNGNRHLLPRRVPGSTEQYMCLGDRSKPQG